MAEAIKVLEDWAPSIVRASMPTAGWIGGPGTTMAVLNRNPLSRNKGNPATPPIVFLYELKRDLNLYLRDWATNTEDQDHGRHRGLQRGERRQGAALRPGPVPRRQRHQGRFERARVQVGACHGPARRQEARPGRLHEPAQARRRAVRRHARAPRSPPRRAIPASGAGRLHLRGSTARTRPTIRLASPSPAAPGASTSCCVWPTPSSRRRSRGGRRPDCQRSRTHHFCQPVPASEG